jgi:hypothetical protein
VVVNLNLNAAAIDENLIHDVAQVDLTGAGAQAAAQARILQNPVLKKNADDVPSPSPPTCPRTSSRPPRSSRRCPGPGSR